ncbi:MAG: VWA domain-containing protein [Dokdonella sp.]|uniref:VWA domain-containing protein n=1 Tax=Dokdonella sp. TaxID=2291710 RepID=UPI002B8585EF|nr:VWA domain-containing protein [Dokdonella sp.]HOX72142.1 VWA domain-containing protein [Dokdonella sp.]HPG93974.1 VWA domain-containing protein [Dokdonella sp.]HPN78009.1 VWA domain-containing protein [Dokdonella sp.]
MRLMLALSLLATTASSAIAGDNVMLVLDASGSMWGQIEGRSKVEIARETVAGVVRGWNPDNALGLVAYGHRRKGDCSDIETLIPLGPLDANDYLETVGNLNALGMTPLSAAVQQAAAALKSLEQKATVILVSDGEETCKLDPCAVGAELEKTGVDFTAHVIGFDVADVAHQAQLRCLASATGGRYFNARDARELSVALQGAIEASSEPPPPPASASLDFAQPVTIARALSVRWSGPADSGDYIAVSHPQQKDGEYLTYSRMLGTDAKQGEISVDAPATAGQYELRYMNPRRGEAVLARMPLQVDDAAASLDAADVVAAGSRLKVTARGPYGKRHWVGFAEVGSPPGNFLNGERLSGAVSELELTPPAKPGKYELRYVLNESERIIVSRPITVVDSEALVSGPASVMAGDTYAFEAHGPDGDRHWIGFAAAGSAPGEYRDYVRPSAAIPNGVLSAPVEAGAYELRYVLNENERIVASQAVTVVPARATLTSAGDVMAAQPLRIEFTGPRGRGNWIGFVRSGTLDYLDYASLPAAGIDVVELSAPAEPGDYELVFVIDRTAVTRKPIAVR